MKTKIASIILSALISLAHGSSPDSLVFSLHKEWMAKHSINYESPDIEEARRLIFADNLEFIAKHNEKFNRGEVSYDLALNPHADLTFGEWMDKFLSYTPGPIIIGDKLHLGEHVSSPLRTDYATIDWRSKGAVTPVKNQLKCGSCWSFSTTGAIEGAHALATGDLVSLSEQQLINCVEGGKFDCKAGGDMVAAYKYVIKNRGLVTEDEDPYRARDHEKCQYRANDGHDYAATISGYKTIPKNNEAALKSALNQQPIAVAIDASQRSFQFYHTGVYDDPACCTNCTEEDLDHGVLAVGYGSENGKDYWLIKNSWSAGWGDKGYVKIRRNDRGRCGVATTASYPIV